ncbi:MAG TPA: DUF2076 domain-containing protein [Bryobacteraceae bacterium]|nr:DUF2076 domain-containing protein [Bryobacteraceae bacterium]
MTEQERQLIQGLVTRIQNAPAPQIDRDADDLIRRSITRPDALYLLVQTVLVQDMALNQAKAQIDELKERATPAASSGFLPNEPNARTSQPGSWGQETHVQQPAPQSTPYQGGNYPPPPPPTPAAPSSGFGSFLHSAATTAAGVIAGETAFSALSSIFGHHGGYSGGSGFLSGAPMSPGSETIINNYYDDDRGRDDDRQVAANDDIRNIDNDDRNDDADRDDQNNDDQSDNDTDDSSNMDDVSSGDNYSDDDGSADV